MFEEAAKLVQQSRGRCQIPERDIIYNTRADVVRVQRVLNCDSKLI